jgi:hypothetical protein
MGVSHSMTAYVNLYLSPHVCVAKGREKREGLEKFLENGDHQIYFEVCVTGVQPSQSSKSEAQSQYSAANAVLLPSLC